MRYDPTDARNPNSGFILSKGHAALLEAHGISAGAIVRKVKELL